MLDYLERLSDFVKIAESRQPTLAECVNAMSDVQAIQVLILRQRASTLTTRCPSCGHLHYEQPAIYCDVCGANIPRR